MKRVDTTAISDSARMPVKKSVIDYLQDAHKETTSEVIKGLIGAVNYATNAIYIVDGIINTSGTNYSAGSIFYNGELYLVDAVNLTSGTPHFSLVNSVDEQVQYSDGSFHDTLISRKAELRVSGGTSIGNYSSAVVLTDLITLKTGATGNVKTTTNQSIDGIKTFTSSPIVPTPTIGTQAVNKTYVDAIASPNPILAAGAYNLGDINPSPSTITITFPNVGTTSYVVMLNFKSNRNPINDQDMVGAKSTGVYTATSFKLELWDFTHGDVQDITIEYILFKI